MCATLALIACALAQSATAGSVVANRTIRVSEVIAAGDIRLDEAERAGAITRVEDVIGQEARALIYAGQPVMAGQIGPMSLVERNQKVAIIYELGTIVIEAEGRALGRGAAGDDVSVMNVASRKVVTGEVANDGEIRVRSGAR